MGQLISLAAHREAVGDARASASRRRATFYFDLACPHTYLGAERVDRMFPGVEWRPTAAESLYVGSPVADARAYDRLRDTAGERASALRMPLVWPERYPAPTLAAMRAACFAVEQGRAAAFVLAASRLAFCGGFDLDDPEVLAEAAAAASLDLQGCLAAAGNAAYDGAMEERGRWLLSAGGDALPALRIGRTLFCGEDRIVEAAGAMRRPPAFSRSLPSAG